MVTKKEVPRMFTAFLLQHDIIDIEWNLDVMEVHKHHLVQLKETIKELGQGKKMRIYISTNPLMQITSDAGKFASSEEGQEFTLANAVLVDSLAKRLLFNFYLSNNKPKTPTKAFKNRVEALAWLQNLT